MTMATEQVPAGPFTLKMKRTVKAKRDRVFDAFVDAEKLAKWWAPHGLTCRVVELNPAVGGKYHYKMTAPDGQTHEVAGEFLDVHPPSRLVMSWQWVGGDTPGAVTEVAFDFVDDGDHTEVRLTHSKFAKEEFRDNHNKGWQSVLDGLEQQIQSL